MDLVVRSLGFSLLRIKRDRVSEYYTMTMLMAEWLMQSKKPVGKQPIGNGTDSLVTTMCRWSTMAVWSAILVFGWQRLTSRDEGMRSAGIGLSG